MQKPQIMRGDDQLAGGMRLPGIWVPAPQGESAQRPPKADIEAILRARASGPQSAPETPTPAQTEAQHAALIEYHQEQVKRAAEALQREQEALDAMARQLETAQAARTRRQQAIADYEQQATRAAQETITSGRAEVSPAERTADEQAERLRRELARGESSVAALSAQHAEAVQRVQVASQALQKAERELEAAQITAKAARLDARLEEVVAEFLLLAKDGRAHNRSVVQLLQHQAQESSPQYLPASQARARGAHMLFLPGARQAKADHSRDTQIFAEQGVHVQFTADLTSADVDESQIPRW